jgi:hypothetical protein
VKKFSTNGGVALGRGRWSLAAALPAAMLLCCVDAAIGASSSTASAQGLGIKTSGPDDLLTNVAAFETWVGAPINYRISFVDQSTWSSNTNPWFLSTTQAWLAQSPNHYEVMGVGLVPNSHPRDFASVINGGHDADFRNLGTVLTNAGVASRTIIRLGWEMNGEWYPWSATPTTGQQGEPDNYPTAPEDFAAAFRRAVTQIRATAPSVKIVWNPNRQSRSWDWKRTYPGDAYVDYVGNDVYDNWNPNGWSDLLNAPQAGLTAFRAFAQQHNKPECYPEWALNPVANQGHGDDTGFIQNMYDWFKAPGASVAFQAYYNYNDNNGNIELYPLISASANSAPLYKSLFGATGGGGGGNTHAGTWAGKAVVGSSASYGKLYQDRSVSTNTSYTASIWAKGSGRVSLSIVNSGWSANLASISITATSAWTKYSVPTFNTASNSQVHFQLYDNLGGTAGTVYLDDGFLGVSGGSNLLANAGFESGNVSWSYNGNAFSIVQPGGATPAAPAAPTGLTATSAVNAQVPLSWNASNGATSYNIYRGTSSNGQSATPIATGVTGTSYTNTGLTNNTTYYYKVTAVGSGGESARSNEASATPGNGNTHAGAWALKAVLGTSASYGKAYQDRSVSTNTTYTASIWVKGTGKLRLSVVNSAWTTDLATVSITATSTWTKYSVPAFSSGSNSTVHFQIYDSIGGVAGTVYLDDAFLGLSGGSNLLSNPGFESGNVNYVISGATPPAFSIVQNP